MKIKLKDILETLSENESGYKVVYFDGGLVSRIYKTFSALYSYSDYYVTSISAEEKEGYGAILCLGLTSKKELK